MILALRKRHDYFAEQGCKLSDHGIEEFYAEDYTEGEIKTIFNKIYGGSELTKEEVLKFKSAMLVVLGEMDWEKDGHNNSITVLFGTITAECSSSWGLIRDLIQ